MFTEVSDEEASELLRALNLGELRELRGIQSGIENTNYFVTAADMFGQREYVLTLFERLTFAQLPFYLHLMKHLAQHGIPVPDPQADQSGDILHTVCGKPAALVNKLARQARAGAGHGALRAGGRDAGAHAPGRPRLQPPPAQPARARLVERDGAGGAALRDPGAGGAAARRAGLPEPHRRRLRLRRAAARARSTPTCSATT